MAHEPTILMIELDDDTAAAHAHFAALQGRTPEAQARIMLMETYGLWKVGTPAQEAQRMKASKGSEEKAPKASKGGQTAPVAVPETNGGGVK